MGCAALSIETEERYALAGGGGIMKRSRTLPGCLRVCVKNLPGVETVGAVMNPIAMEGSWDVTAAALLVIPFFLGPGMDRRSTKTKWQKN
jgi:hypothetical protein